MDKPTNARVASSLCMHQLQHQVLIADHQQVHQVISSSQPSHPSAHPILNTSLQTQVSTQYFTPLTRPVCMTTSTSQQLDQRVLDQRTLEQRVLDQRVIPFDGSLTDTNSIQIGVAQQPQQQQVSADIQSISNMINEKVSIYRHPLFPLLRILFEKCEIATNSIDTVHAITFDHEIKAFITQMAKENEPFFTEDAEVDGLMLKSLQVLRIHLLELEKVNELCKDFCTRYISCLRGKLNSDNIMKTLDINATPPASPTHHVSTPSTSSIPIHTDTNHIQNTTIESFDFADSKPILDQQVLQHCNDISSLSSISICQTNSHSPSTSVSHSDMVDSSDINAETVGGISVSELTSGFLSKKNKCGKRGVLPKQATNVLKAWLFQHLVHPYPSEEEKKRLAEQTSLSILQVNNWFINARRRILQPMLETTNSFLKNNKKTKMHRNAAQNNWTNSIGVYNAYRTEALQHQSTNASVGFVVTPSIVPQSSTMLVNLSDGQTQPVIISQPLQFVQVSQMPVQTIAAGCLNGTQNVAAQAQIVSTSQQSIMMPLLQEKIANENLIAGLSDG